MEINFERHGAQCVMYPSLSDFQEYSRFAEGLVKDSTRDYNILFSPPQEEISLVEMEQLKAIARRDPLAEISEQEKVKLWKLRYKNLYDIE